MKKTDELKNKLIEIFSNRTNWDKHIEIDGERYIYISAKNEIRRTVKQPSGEIAVLVACFAFGRFMWCC